MRKIISLIIILVFSSQSAGIDYFPVHAQRPDSALRPVSTAISKKGPKSGARSSSDTETLAKIERAARMVKDGQRSPAAQKGISTILLIAVPLAADTDSDNSSILNIAREALIAGSRADIEDAIRARIALGYVKLQEIQMLIDILKKRKYRDINDKLDIMQFREKVINDMIEEAARQIRAGVAGAETGSFAQKGIDTLLELADDPHTKAQFREKAIIVISQNARIGDIRQAIESRIEKALEMDKNLITLFESVMRRGDLSEHDIKIITDLILKIMVQIKDKAPVLEDCTSTLANLLSRGTMRLRIDVCERLVEYAKAKRSVVFSERAIRAIAAIGFKSDTEKACKDEIKQILEIATVAEQHRHQELADAAEECLSRYDIGWIIDLCTKVKDELTVSPDSKTLLSFLDRFKRSGISDPKAQALLFEMLGRHRSTTAISSRLEILKGLLDVAEPYIRIAVVRGIGSLPFGLMGHNTAFVSREHKEAIRVLSEVLNKALNADDSDMVFAAAENIAKIGTIAEIELIYNLFRRAPTLDSKIAILHILAGLIRRVKESASGSADMAAVDDILAHAFDEVKRLFAQCHKNISGQLMLVNAAARLGATEFLWDTLRNDKEDLGVRREAAKLLGGKEAFEAARSLSGFLLTKNLEVISLREAAREILTPGDFDNLDMSLRTGTHSGRISEAARKILSAGERNALDMFLTSGIDFSDSMMDEIVITLEKLCQETGGLEPPGGYDRETVKAWYESNDSVLSETKMDEIAVILEKLCEKIKGLEPPSDYNRETVRVWWESNENKIITNTPVFMNNEGDFYFRDKQYARESDFSGTDMVVGPSEDVIKDITEILEKEFDRIQSTGDITSLENGMGAIKDIAWSLTMALGVGPGGVLTEKRNSLFSRAPERVRRQAALTTAFILFRVMNIYIKYGGRKGLQAQESAKEQPLTAEDINQRFLSEQLQREAFINLISNMNFLSVQFFVTMLDADLLKEHAEAIFPLLLKSFGYNNVKAILEALSSDKHANARISLVKYLCSLSDPESLVPITKMLLECRHPAICSMLIGTIADIGGPQAIESLGLFLQRSDFGVKALESGLDFEAQELHRDVLSSLNKIAIRVLREIERDPRLALKAEMIGQVKNAIEMLKDYEAKARVCGSSICSRETASSISLIKHKKEDIEKDIYRKRGRDERTAFEILEQLQTIDHNPRFIDDMSTTSSPDAGVSIAAYNMVLRFGSIISAENLSGKKDEFLSVFMEEADPYTQIAALKGLGYIYQRIEDRKSINPRNPSGVDFFVQNAGTDLTNEFIALLGTRCADYGLGSPERLFAVRFIIDALGSDESGIIMQAFRSLSGLFSTEGSRLMNWDVVMHGQSDDVKIRAARAIAWIDDWFSFSFISCVVQDSSPEVRKEASSAFARLFNQKLLSGNVTLEQVVPDLSSRNNLVIELTEEWLDSQLLPALIITACLEEGERTGEHAREALKKMAPSPVDIPFLAPLLRYNDVRVVNAALERLEQLQADISSRTRSQAESERIKEYKRSLRDHVPALLSLLDAGDDRITRVAKLLLEKSDDPDISQLPELRKFLKKSNPLDVKLHAMQQIGRLASNAAKGALEVLRQSGWMDASQPTGVMADSVTEALQSIVSITALVRDLNFYLSVTNDPALERAIINAILHIGQAFASSEADTEVDILTTEELGRISAFLASRGCRSDINVDGLRIKDVDIVGMLTGVMTNIAKEEDTRRAALHGLGYINSNRSLATIRDFVVAPGEDLAFKLYAIEKLKKTPGELARTMLKTIEAGAEDEALKQAAREAVVHSILKMLKSESVITFMTHVLMDEPKYVRIAALGYLASEPNPAVNHLIKHIAETDSDPEIREAASFAYEAMDTTLNLTNLIDNITRSDLREGDYLINSSSYPAGGSFEDALSLLGGEDAIISDELPPADNMEGDELGTQQLISPPSIRDPLKIGLPLTEEELRGMEEAAPAAPPAIDTASVQEDIPDDDDGLEEFFIGFEDDGTAVEEAVVPDQNIQPVTELPVESAAVTPAAEPPATSDRPSILSFLDYIDLDDPSLQEPVPDSLFLPAVEPVPLTDEVSVADQLRDSLRALDDQGPIDMSFLDEYTEGIIKDPDISAPEYIPDDGGLEEFFAGFENESETVAGAVEGLEIESDIQAAIRQSA